MEWIALNETQVLADLPTELDSLYTAWLVANPTKATRLAEITANTVEEFRVAITSNPANVLDDDTTKIPQSCVRAAETIIYYSLMMEMGISIKAEALQSMTRAEMFLRMVGYKHLTTESAATTTTKPIPIYTAPEDRDPLDERMLP
jgi:hypothetical protein